MVRNHEDPGSQGSLCLQSWPLPRSRIPGAATHILLSACFFTCVHFWKTSSQRFLPLGSAQALLHLLCPLRTSTTFCGFSHLHPFSKGTNDDHPIKLCKHPVGPPESSRVLYFLWPSVLMSMYVCKEISPPTPKGQEERTNTLI